MRPLPPGIRPTWLLAFLIATVVGLARPAPGATEAVSALLGRTMTDRAGERIGQLRDLIVDVHSGHVVYLLIDTPDREHTVPARALDEQLRLDMELSGEAARLKSMGDPKFRRASRLLGLPVTDGHGNLLGTIADIRFWPKTGWIEQVLVRDGDEWRAMRASVLSGIRFPRPTEWAEQPPGPAPDEPSEEPPEQREGFVVEPSDERRRLQGPPRD